jgi:hypothetical protein
LKQAAELAPSAKAAVPLPAMVVTTPWGVTFRMRWLYVSLTYKVSKPSMASPEGLENVAAVPVPSEKTVWNMPANTVEKPSGETLRITPYEESSTNR